MQSLQHQRLAPAVATPQKFAEEGERIYRERYKADFVKERDGCFVAIDVLTEKAYIGNTGVAALQTARQANPRGMFYLLRVGSPTAYKFGSR